MTQIVTYNEYILHNPAAATLPAAEVNNILDISQQIIYRYTSGRIDGYDDYPADVRERIDKAICYQADYLIANGGTDFINGNIPNSATIGSFSYSIGDGTSTEIALCNVSLTYLLPTGLMYRGDVDAL